MRSSTPNLSGRSDLFPRTRRGMPSRIGFRRSVWSSSRAIGRAAISAESTMKTIALAPRQYRSHIALNLGCPPKSQHLSVTWPFCTLFMLKPTVGIESVVNSPPERTLNRDVLPAFCKPIIVISISVAQNKLSSQSYIRLKNPAMIIDASSNRTAERGRQ